MKKKGRDDKIQKGSPGYIKSMRKNTLIHMIVLFLIAFAIFFTGKFRYSEYSTMFSITAIVVCIPASMRCVSFIMFMLHRGGDREFYDKCLQIAGKDDLFFESVITTSEKSYDVYAFGIFEDNIIGYCPEKNKDISKLEKHLRDMFEKNSYGSAGIKIFTESDKFLSRLEQLSSKELKNEERVTGMRGLIANLSL